MQLTQVYRVYDSDDDKEEPTEVIKGKFSNYHFDAYNNVNEPLVGDVYVYYAINIFFPDEILKPLSINQCD